MKKTTLCLALLLAGCGGDGSSPTNTNSGGGDSSTNTVSADQVFEQATIVTDPSTGISYQEVSVKANETLVIKTTNDKPFTIARSTDAPQRLVVQGNLTISAK
ncbi:hypothetical protein LRP50_23190 [Enterovibrio sp. ZSDZ42]|uniref:Uncharacterized protein n=1 Tax=Enterovibrio gelatinilyticus TaxID=2899819 RepID=A0ABT5R6Y3_9GAMM|nr:hypothetical protein [Enterovibrio sp. ZSDZ42]MDD1796029.1 hypothetical protein [Enterovibrio sp. ZSDZ42]